MMTVNGPVNYNNLAVHDWSTSAAGKPREQSPVQSRQEAPHEKTHTGEKETKSAGKDKNKTLNSKSN